MASPYTFVPARQHPQVKECNRLALGLRASDLPSDGGSLDGRADRRRVAGTAGPSGCPACRTGSSTGTVRPSRPAYTAAPLAPCPRARSAANSPWWRRSPPLGGFAKCGLPPLGGGPQATPHCTPAQELHTGSTGRLGVLFPPLATVAHENWVVAEGRGDEHLP